MNEDPFATRFGRQSPPGPPAPPAETTEAVETPEAAEDVQPDPLETRVKPGLGDPQPGPLETRLPAPPPAAVETPVEAASAGAATEPTAGPGPEPAETRVKAQPKSAATRVRRTQARPAAAPAPAAAAAAAPAAGEVPAVWRPAGGEPAPARRSLPWGLMGAALVVVAGAGFAAGWLSHGSGRAAPASTPAPFLVTGLSATLAPGKLACPAAVAHLSGTIRTDHGGGTIRYQWVLPGGATTTATTLAFAANQKTGVATLAYTLTGRGSLSGLALLHVLSPLSAYAAPVHIRYTCAAKKK